MNAANPPTSYPLHIQATLDRDLSRGLWLINRLRARDPLVVAVRVLTR